MKAKHNHRCVCEHEQVRFCKQCKVVHCLDCNKEWRDYNWTSPYWYYGNYTYYSSQIRGAIQGSSKGYLQQLTTTLDKADTQNPHLTTTACDHKF